MGGQHGVVWLNHRVCHGWGRVHAEFQFRFLAIVDREPFLDQSTETRASTATERMEDEKPLQAIAVVSKAPDLVHHSVNLLLADGIVTSCI